MEPPTAGGSPEQTDGVAPAPHAARLAQLKPRFRFLPPRIQTAVPCLQSRPLVPLASPIPTVIPFQFSVILHFNSPRTHVDCGGPNRS